MAFFSYHNRVKMYNLNGDPKEVIVGFDMISNLIFSLV